MTNMPSAIAPLVSVLTPVYKNADDLAECPGREAIRDGEMPLATRSSAHI